MRGLWMAIVFSGLLVGLPLWSHGGPAQPSPSPPVDSLLSTTGSGELAENSTGSGETSLVQQLLGHLHNKLVHFPVALAFVAFLFALLAFRFEEFVAPLKVLVLLGFLAAVAAVAAGEAQKGPYLQTPMRTILRLHEGLGWTIAGTYGLWSLLAFLKLPRRWHWVPGLVLVLLVSVAGFLGGRMAHP